MFRHGLVAISTLFVSFFYVGCGPRAPFNLPPEINTKITIEREQVSILLADDPSITIFAKGFKENSGEVLILNCPCYVADSGYRDKAGILFKIANEELLIEKLRRGTTRFQFKDMNVSAAR